MRMPWLSRRIAKLLCLLRIADRLPLGDEVGFFLNAGLLAFVVGVKMKLRSPTDLNTFLGFGIRDREAVIQIFCLPDEDRRKDSV